MMNCDKTQSLLNEYIDGTLEPDLKKAVQLHLDNDPKCRQVFSEAVALQRQMQNLQQVLTSPEFDINLRKRIIESQEHTSRQLVLNKKGWSLAFSGAILTAALYLFIFTDFGDQSIPPEGIMPSSTIGNGSPAYKVQSPDPGVKMENISAEEVITDSLKQTPEQVNESQLHMTGEQK